MSAVLAVPATFFNNLQIIDTAQDICFAQCGHDER